MVDHDTFYRNSILAYVSATASRAPIGIAASWIDRIAASEPVRELLRWVRRGDLSQPYVG